MARDYPVAAYAVRQNKEARLIVTRHVLFRLSRLHRITLSGASRIIAVSEAVASQLRSDGVAAPERSASFSMELIRLDLKKQDGSLIVSSFFAVGTFLTTAYSLGRLES